MRIFFSIQLAVLTAIFMMSTAVASAHSTGSSWNATDGAFTVDVGHDPAAFTAGQYTRFDFLLWKGAVNTGEAAAFAQVWIRIIRDDSNTVLATGLLHQPIGPTTLLYEFDTPGTYKIETSFRDADGTDIAVASFPFTVQKESGANTQGMVAEGAIFLGGMFFGALGFYIGGRKRI